MTATNAAAAETAIEAWFKGRLPEDWFESGPTVGVDRDEIVVTGRLTAPASKKAAEAHEATEAAAGRIARWRENTRSERITIGREAERRFDRKVSWGADCGEVSQIFSNLSAPVMTRLRQPQRQVLDTLVDAGVARSRSHALAWCVRLVGQHTDDWLASLRDAMTELERAREAGPGASSSTV